MRTQNSAVPPNTFEILKAIKGLTAAFSFITFDNAARVTPSIKAVSVIDKLFAFRISSFKSSPGWVLCLIPLFISFTLFGWDKQFVLFPLRLLQIIRQLCNRVCIHYNLLLRFFPFSLLYRFANAGHCFYAITGIETRRINGVLVPRSSRQTVLIQ